jgi:hypothetical protein
VAGGEVIARFTYQDMILCSFFNLGTGWIIVAMWPLDGMYLSPFWVPRFCCPWAGAPPLVGNGGGGDQSCQNHDSESDRNLDGRIANHRIITIRIVKS